MMRLRKKIRSGTGPLFGEGRGGRWGLDAPTGLDDAPALPVRKAFLTSRDIMAAARERLAARGFDWSDALWTGRASPSAEQEVGR